MKASTRSILLAFLKENDWVSGESLSEKLNISRAAIWKNIKSLRELGYNIESSSRVGYRLADSPDLLIPDEIIYYLETEVIGRQQIHYFSSVSSTNTAACARAEAGDPEGTIVVAEFQKAGKGRLGRDWHSPSGENLYISLILRPEISPSEASGVTLLAAVAAADTLKEKNIDPVIKWPNDILVNGKKIAGILTEMSSDQDQVHYIIPGIGININTNISKMPEGLRTQPASILSETGKKMNRAEFTALFLQKFESLYLDFKINGFSNILEQWKKYSNIIGRKVKVELLRGTVCGICESIDSTGALIVRDEEGAINHIISGDVTLSE